MVNELLDKLKTYLKFFDIEDEEERVRIQYLLIVNILGVVSLFMTVVNEITGWKRLGIITALFAAACFITPILENKLKKSIIARGFFAVSMIAMFTSFLIFGDPEGFSVMWILLLPACGCFLFRIKWGIIINAIQFLIIVFFCWIKIGNGLLQYEYSKVFLQRFPVVYVAFTFVGILLELVRSNAQTKLDASRNVFKHMANHDMLTGIYNRYGFNTTLDEFVANRNGSSCAFAIFDLDKFKNVNDAYGHMNGDIVLRDVAVRTEGYVGNRGIVCRWGGEEFSILFNSAEDAEAICNELLDIARTREITLDKYSIIETFSLGLVLVEEGQEIDTSRLVNIADTNLYMAKEAGRNRIITTTYSETQPLVEKL